MRLLPIAIIFLTTTMGTASALATESIAESPPQTLIFPAGICLGNITGSKGYNRINVAAQGKVSLPQAADLRLQANQTILEHPDYLRKVDFRHLGLDLSKIPINDDWLTNITHLSRLRDLRLRGCNITDKGITTLTRLPLLRTLDVRRTQIRGLAFKQLPNLQQLLAGENQYDSPEAITQICSLKDLRLLTLTYSAFTWMKNLRSPEKAAQADLVLAKSFGQMKNLKQMYYLSLEGQPLGTHSFQFLKSMPQLRHLRVASTAITPEVVRLLNPDILQNLDVSHCTNIDDTVLPFIKRCRRMTYLCLGHTKITGDGVAQIDCPTIDHLNLRTIDLHKVETKLFRSMPNLRELELPDTKLTNAGVKNIVRLHRLRHLDLSGNKIDDACVEGLSSMKSLVLLDISATNISESGYRSLKRALPKCRLLWQ